MKDDLSLGFGALPFFPNADPFVGNSPLTQYNYVASPGAAPSGQALMCLAQQGWTSMGKEPTAGVNFGRTRIQYWTKIIDLSDGWTEP